MKEKKLIPNLRSSLEVYKKIIVGEQNEERKVIDFQSLEEIVNNTGKIQHTNESILSLHPDIELTKKVKVGSIISPNDFSDAVTIYTVKNSLMSLTATQNWCSTIKDDIDENYDLEGKLPDIIGDSLFQSGAYAECIIPGTALADMFKSADKQEIEFSSEELTKEVSGLSYDKDNVTNTTFINNIELLGTSRAMELKQRKSTLDKYSCEDLSKVDDEIAELLTVKDTSISMFKELKVQEEIIGKPLILKLPTESVVVLAEPANPSNHRGYLVFLDENNSPVVYSETSDISYLRGKDEITSRINRAREQLALTENKAPTIHDIELKYSGLVEKRIKKQLKEMFVGDVTSVPKTSEIYSMMFSRYLRNKQTRILYVPTEFMMYYAFDYRENGTGKTLMEKNTVLFGLRSLLLISGIKANIKNATTNTNYKITLDKDDKLPEKSLQKAMNAILMNQENQFPSMFTNLSDAFGWAQRLGVSVSVDHPDLPDLEINKSEDRGSVNIDTSFEELLGKRTIQGLGVMPELIDHGLNQTDFTLGEFIRRNALFAKQVKKDQDIIMASATISVKKYIAVNEFSRKKLKEIIKKDLPHIKKEIRSSLENGDKIIKVEESKLIDFIFATQIEKTSVKLPEPANDTIRETSDGFDTMKTAIETMVDTFVSTDKLIGQNPPEIITNNIDKFKSLLVSTFLKQWSLDNGYMTDLFDMLRIDENGEVANNVLSEAKDQQDSLVELFEKIFKETDKETILDTSDDVATDINQTPTDPVVSDPIEDDPVLEKIEEPKDDNIKNKVDSVEEDKTVNKERKNNTVQKKKDQKEEETNSKKKSGNDFDFLRDDS